MANNVLSDVLDQIVKTVTADTVLEAETKSSLLDLATEVAADPTPANIDALTLVLKKVGQMESYVAALTSITNLSIAG